MSTRTPRDDADFTAFVHASRGRLGRTALLLAGSAAAADDLLQEGLVRVYLAWDRVDRGTAEAYTRRVLANLHADGWRRSRRLTMVPLDDRDSQTVTAEDAFRAVELRDAVVQRLAVLTTRERTMVVLRYYHDLSEADVAQQLGCSVGTVKSTCSRALARLGGHHDEKVDVR